MAKIENALSELEIQRFRQIYMDNRESDTLHLYALEIWRQLDRHALAPESLASADTPAAQEIHDQFAQAVTRRIGELYAANGQRIEGIKQDILDATRLLNVGVLELLPDLDAEKIYDLYYRNPAGKGTSGKIRQ